VQVPDAALAPLSTDELSFDAGRVISGEVLTHTFRLKNTTGEALALAKDTDVQPNCGCSAIVPAQKSLTPGAETDVTVTIRTGGLRRKQGPFAHGGRIVWTAESGRRHATSLTVRGDAIPPLCSEPTVVHFNAQDVRNGVVKELVLTAQVPIDWSTLALSSSSNYFQLVEGSQAKEGEKVRCQVKCVPPECIEDFGGEIIAKAQVRRTDSEEFPVSITVPVGARQKVDLAVSPTVVPVTFGPSGSSSPVRLVFRGDKAAKGEIAIQSITYEGCKVTWKLSQGRDSAIVEVTLVREPAKQNGKEAQQNDKEPPLIIQMAGGKFISLPVVAVGPSLDAP
jgi:hypothetical protein